MLFVQCKALLKPLIYQGICSRHQLNNCILIGDKGYLSQQYQQDLFETSNIKVETPMRKNNANFKPFPKALSKARK